MPFYARKQIVNPHEIGVYHCTTRCVRRAFLCGRDQWTGNSYEHRRAWLVDRLRFLASIFAIDVCGFSAMSNHYHLILRIRPDLAKTWSDDEVALRWWRLYPRRRNPDGSPADPLPHELGMLKADPTRLLNHRLQLASLSWFMREVNEHIARRANLEDDATGRFWEGRFKSQALLDEAAMLACLVYVDLNPIRAGIADTPEKSEFTSAHDRIRSLLAETRSLVAADEVQCNETAMTADVTPAAAEPVSTMEASPVTPTSWLCEMTLKEGPDVPLNDGTSYLSPERAAGDGAVRGFEPVARASDRGLLPLTLTKYLKLLDWTGRELRQGKRGAIPVDLAPILERLGIRDENWVETVRHFGRWFKRAAGRGAAMSEAATRSGQRWYQGAGQSRIAFT